MPRLGFGLLSPVDDPGITCACTGDNPAGRKILQAVHPAFRAPVRALADRSCKYPTLQANLLAPKNRYPLYPHFSFPHFVDEIFQRLQGGRAQARFLSTAVSTAPVDEMSGFLGCQGLHTNSAFNHHYSIVLNESKTFDAGESRQKGKTTKEDGKGHGTRHQLKNCTIWYLIIPLFKLFAKVNIHINQTRKYSKNR